MYRAGEDDAGTRLCLVVAGEGVHYVPASGPAFSPPAGRLLVRDVTDEQAIEVRRRTWRIALQLPSSGLRVTPGELEEVLAQQVPWQEWQSSFLANFCRSMLSLHAVEHSIPSTGFDQLVTGAAEFVIRSSLDGERELSASSLRRALARDYIALHVSDPGLSPEAAAGDQGITLRQLARCFAAEGTTVSAEIKRIRLERAQQFLLAHAGQRKISMADVARMHGFSSLSHFSRSFVEAYDVPPSQLLKP